MSRLLFALSKIKGQIYHNWGQYRGTLVHVWKILHTFELDLIWLHTINAFTIALYLTAIALANVDLPLIGGPSTQTLQGILGFGGLR